MALKLKGSTSGFVAIDAPSVAGNNTLILPENTGSAHQILANDITAGVTTFTQITVSRNGDLTVPGTISIGGTLTYEDVTSVDSVGIVTARGLSIFGNTTGLNVASGISTFQTITGATATLSGNLNLADSIIHTGDTNTKIRFPSNDTIQFETSGQARVNINSSGKVLVSTQTASTVGNSQYSMFEVSGNTSGATGAGHVSIKRGETSASLSDGDTIARLIFSSLDGGDFAYIQASVDGSPSGSDFPASLRFHTCADGANSSTERLRIASNGFIGMGGATGPEEVLDLGNNVQINLKVGGRAYLGQGYSTAATILGHAVKAKTTGTVSGGMEVTETNSGGGAPVAVRMVSGTFQVHTATSGTSGATFDNEKLRIASNGSVNIGDDFSQTTYKTQIEAADQNVLRLVTDSDDANGVEFVLRKDSASPADEDNIGNIYFQGNDSGGNATFYSSIEAYSDDVTNGSENGYIRFRTRNDGTMAERVRIGSDGRMLIGTSSFSNISSNAPLTIKSSGSSATRLNLENSGSSSPESTQIFSQNNELAFTTSGAESLRIESDGFLKLKNNKGLNFANQTRTSTTNYNTTVTGEKFDYYEEGTLDPTAISAGLTFDTNNNKQLRYVRIGHWVSVSGYLDVSSYTSNSNVIQIAMPFTSAANSDGYYTRGVGAVMYRYVNLSSNYDQLIAYVGGGENYMRFFQSRSSSGDWLHLVNNNLASNSAAFYFSVNYMVA